MKFFTLAFKRAFDFRGRSSRPEFWYFILFYFIALIIASFIDRGLGNTFKMDLGLGEQDLGYGYVYLGFALVSLIPYLAVGVRRLHDVGKSGWMFLISLIPLIGIIWLIILWCKDSQPGENKWGPNPKGVPSIDGDLLKM